MTQKKIIIIYAGVFLCLSTFTIPVFSMNLSNDNGLGPLPATHTVLVEACTASWCSPCAVAAVQIHNIYQSGEYDFEYVALVSDKNPYANQRCAELGVGGIPDYVFDGGYARWVGSGGLPAAYTSRLIACEKRSVAAVDVDLDVTWLEDGLLDVAVDLMNNEEEAYDGHLHVYVTEIESRWNTYSGQPYHFAMIGNYPLNKDVSIAANETLHLQTQWDGAAYGFDDIEMDNILVIATVFDETTEYVDDTAAAPPRIPSDVTGDGVVDVLDLLQILAVWDQTGDPGWIAEDVTDDGVIDVLDLLEVLGHWT